MNEPETDKGNSEEKLPQPDKSSSDRGKFLEPPSSDTGWDKLPPPHDSDTENKSIDSLKDKELNGGDLNKTGSFDPARQFFNGSSYFNCKTS